jgi:hypothetical protein
MSSEKEGNEINLAVLQFQNALMDKHKLQAMCTIVWTESGDARTAGMAAPNSSEREALTKVVSAIRRALDSDYESVTVEGGLFSEALQKK